MFTLVLLALADQGDGREAARLASSIAARHGAGFAAQSVSAPLSQEGGCVLQLPGEDILAERRAGLEALLREVMPPGLTADVLQSAGFAHVEILKTARVLGPDLLVVGGLDAAELCRRELSDSRRGAAALIAEGAPCPVLVAAPATQASQGPFERILTAVDLSAHSGDSAHARTQLTFAARLAAREGADLIVLNVLRLSSESGGQPALGQPELERSLTSARERLAFLCHGLPGADRFTLLASEGSAGVEILKHARERQADLLLLARPEKGAVGDVLDYVLEGARCPVMLVDSDPSAASAATSTSAPRAASAAKG